ncbi:MAG: MnhB domain-containing protein [Azospirillaceae bacterium]
MNSLILTAAARLLVPLMVAFSIFILLRGHNEPGGGFIGGLIAATAFALYAKARGTEAACAALPLTPAAIAVTGLAGALAAALWGALATGHVLGGVWPLLETAPDGTKEGLPVGSILLFDVGVYLVVVGAVLAILFGLEDDVIDEDDGAEDDGRTVNARADADGGPGDGGPGAGTPPGGLTDGPDPGTARPGTTLEGGR